MVMNPSASMETIVAGVVPAVFRRLDHSRLFGAEIAEHDVGPAHEQASAFGDARHGLEAGFHQRRETADGARLVGKRRVDGEHGGRFGDAVAFEIRTPNFSM